MNHLSLLRIKVARLARWEFWPAWAIYALIVPRLVIDAVRARGSTVCTAVNPSIPLNDVIGESKAETLSQLPAAWTITSHLITPGQPSGRMSCLTSFMQQHNLSWPIILKPNVGERGTGVRLITSADAAERYLTRYQSAAIAQEYHAGPYEAGIFYIRYPSQPSGIIFSMTDKQFPQVTGDGTSTLTALIERNPRLRLQLHIFLARLGERHREVPSRGQVVALAIAGNHCRGTTFLDGTAIGTEALRQTFDTISHATPGFYFGRFDVRYRDRADLIAGCGFKIIELNGLLSEATHIYAPGTGFWAGQQVLREQWRHAFAIGRENVRRGVRPPGLRELFKVILAHRHRPDADAESD